MNKFYIAIIIIFLAFFLNRCKNDDDRGSNEGQTMTPVIYNPAQIPYAKLSDYNFFKGDLKKLEPHYGVLPYEPINSLFTDYAHKKRFIWMPTNSNASYVNNQSIFDFPEGTMLIKNFYYEKVMPDEMPQIIETRMMIMQNGEWIFANYVWDENQNEAYLNLDGEVRPIEFKENNQVYNSNYLIPNESECLVCHKTYNSPTPLAVKPQNLNKSIIYNDGTAKNQLLKWKDFGYLGNIPNQISQAPNWQDPSESLQDRVRGYLDTNCAHCHTDGGHCEYTPMRFSFAETISDYNLGICVPTSESIPSYFKIIEAGNPARSALLYRITNDEPNIKMPFIGTSLHHQEAVDLITNWISSLESCN